MDRPRPALVLAAAAVVLAALACEAPLGSGTVEPERVETALEETLAVEATGTAAAAPTATGTDEATSTPTATATPTPTITPTAPPFAELTQNTNCRTGPLRVYDLIVTFLRGQRVEIVGKNAEGTYWYVADPGSPEVTCWMWGRYAQVSGDTGSVPVFTPPPTPTASATPTPLDYDWSGEWQAWIDGEARTITLIESGSSVEGDVSSFAFCPVRFNCRVEGTRSEAGRVVTGDIITLVGDSGDFSWAMLDSLVQFTGQMDIGNGPVPFCGARIGFSMPEPCMGP